MAFDLYSIDYLKVGSARQQKAYAALRELNPLALLADDHDAGFGQEPALVGSLPLDLALDSSDLDFATYSSDLKSYGLRLRQEFGSLEGFESSRGIQLGVATLITRFSFQDERFEILTQNVPVPRQNAVVHVMIEERLLLLGGDQFREKVWASRMRGLKTEPAMGELLGLTEPYLELLDLEDLSDSELRRKFSF